MATRSQPRTRRRLVGVSTKMYFSAARTASFVSSTLELLSSSPPDLKPSNLDIDMFLVPDHVTLTSVIAQVRATPAGSVASRLLVGAQNCHSSDTGPFTGEVSPAMLAEVGCALVELGHAERRRLFGETDASTAEKAAAVVRNGMVPLVCVGEANPPFAAHSSSSSGNQGQGTATAVEDVMIQVRSVLAAVPADKEVILAYEPVWAIGAAEPAPAEHVCEVARRVRESEEVKGRKGDVRILYGGSAGPGLYAKLKDELDGLFLGRFAHDPGQFYRTICEVAEA